MVVADLDVKGVAILEPKADPPLIVDRYRVLTFAVTLQSVQAVAPWRLQVIERRPMTSRQSSADAVRSMPLFDAASVVHTTEPQDPRL